MLTMGLVVLALAAPPKERRVEEAPPRPGQRECVAVLVSPPGGEPASTFSASETLDLEVRVRLRQRLRGRHRLEVRLFTPYGHLYQVLASPFDVSTPGERLAGRGSSPSAGVRLPVAGSAITGSSLYGEWSAVPYLDGETEPCGATGRFVIDP